MRALYLPLSFDMQITCWYAVIRKGKQSKSGNFQPYKPTRHTAGTRQTNTVLLHGAAAEAFDPKSITDVCQREGHINFMYGVAATMTRLLASQPLSHPPEDYNGDLVDAYHPWPTPTAPQRAEIQTVALRLMVLLEWCTGELPGNEYTPEEVEDLVALKRVLVVLLHQLLLSHIMNPKLSMERIFRFELSQVSAKVAKFFFALVCNTAKDRCCTRHAHYRLFNPS